MHIICRLFPLFVLSFLFVWYLISSFPFYISRRSPFSPLLFVCFGFGFGVWKLRILSLSPFLLFFFFLVILIFIFLACMDRIVFVDEVIENARYLYTSTFMGSRIGVQTVDCFNRV